MTDSIEVFQDLNLRGPKERRMALRDELVASTAHPWSVNLARSEEFARNSVSSTEVLSFRREPADGLPAASLSLWGTDDGYYVPNVVPVESGKLSYRQYNAILKDFLAKVLHPVAPRFDFVAEITSDRQDVEDWLSPDAVMKLRAFSNAANKSTGASHPMDQRRWFEFVIAVHRSGTTADSELLRRWLQEVEQWDKESAHELTGDYETSLALLRHYDEI
jgi:hypothetical protein